MTQLNTTQNTKRGGVRPGSGRPKGVPNKTRLTLNQKADWHCDDALAVLVAVAMNVGEPSSIRVQAANMILSYGTGKKRVHVEAELASEEHKSTDDVINSLPSNAIHCGQPIQGT